MAIELKRTGSAEYGQYMKVLICGEPGAGKTLISSTFPNPVIASAEGGLMSLADRHVPYVEVTKTDQLDQLKNVFTQPPAVREQMLGVPAETLVIDTLDEIQKLLIKERNEAQRQDAFKVQDWGWLGDQMRLIVRTLRNLDAHVVFTCHLKRVENQESGAVNYEPLIQGGFCAELPGYVDLALVLKARPVAKQVGEESKRVMVRMIQTFPDNTYPWLKDRSGKLPQFFEANLNDDFQRINRRIFGSSPAAADPAPAQSSAPEDGAPQADAPAAGAETPVEVADTADVTAPAEEPKPVLGNCSECGDDITSVDLMDMCVVKRLPPLCTPHYKARTAK